MSTFSTFGAATGLAAPTAETGTTANRNAVNWIVRRTTAQRITRGGRATRSLLRVYSRALAQPSSPDLTTDTAPSPRDDHRTDDQYDDRRCSDDASPIWVEGAAVGIERHETRS